MRACAACRCARRLDEPPGMPLGLVAPLPAGIVQLEWCATFAGPCGTPCTPSSTAASDGSRPVSAGPWRSAGGVPAAAAICWCRCRSIRRDAASGASTRRRTSRGASRPSWGCPWSHALERRTRTVAQHCARAGRAGRNLGGAFAVRPDRRARGRGSLGASSSTTSRPPARRSPNVPRRCARRRPARSRASPWRATADRASPDARARPAAGPRWPEAPIIGRRRWTDAHRRQGQEPGRPRCRPGVRGAQDGSPRAAPGRPQRCVGGALARERIGRRTRPPSWR